MKKFLLTPLLMLTTLCASAQTDLSRYMLVNYGFDTQFDYTAGQTTNVTQEIKDVEGWTADLSADYTIVGTYEFGFKGVYNTASVPATSYNNGTGGGLAISTGWDQTFLFYQTVTLPAGSYTVNVPTYNGSDKTAATSQLAWIPTGGTAVKSNISSYPTRQWTLDKITFTLTKTTTGKIQFGMKAASGGSANSAKLLVDYVQLLGENMTVDKSGLQSAITSANTYYGDGTGNEAAALQTAITAAQAIYDNAEADLITVLEGTQALNEAITVYRRANISEENPLDVTKDYIVNPSFENSTNGWEVENLVTQTNSSFTKKSGGTYLEKWTGSGSVGSGYVKQTITLPNGVYKLMASAQNYTQSSTSKKNTGAYIYAGDQQEIVYTPADYTVKFTSIAGQVEIGYIAENATGNWICVDNFRLYQIGTIDATAAVAELTRIIGTAEHLMSQTMSATTSANLQHTIDAAKLITDASAETDLQAATLALQAAISAAQTSISKYAALATQITTIEASYDASKEGAEAFKAELDKAKALVVNTAATSDELASEIAALDKALLAFNLANATAGTGTVPKVTVTNHYIATGSTEALVRATMTGSNILERGVCWSTEHEPTVLDNRTTEYHSLKGNIYHIRGMQPATVYYVRPYVMNKTYTVAYGDEVKIVTHPKGTCRGTWNEGAPDEAANARCRKAIAETIDYFNEWTGIMGFTLTGNYGAGTPTADCSYGGWMRIGPNAGNQAIGTVLHETGHGVGVGTHWRWNNCADTRANTTYGKWLGREANQVLRFLENYDGEEVFMTGDAVHGWGTTATGATGNATISFDWFVNGADKDKHLEIQYVGGMCLLHGLFIDGLCPTTGYANGISGYTYNFDDAKKYYIMNKDAERGLGEGLLYQRNSTSLGWKPMLTDETVDESAAWYMEFNSSTGFYHFKNASTGRYLTHASNGTNVTLKNVTTNPSITERFQLMPDRTDVTIGVGSSKIKTHGYWFTWTDGSNVKSMSANALGRTSGYGTIPQETFDFSDKATKQQWIIISEDELEAYQAAAISTGIKTVATGDTTPDGTKTVVGICTIDGVQLQATQKGFNIIKYSDGSTKKIFVE